MNWIAPSFTPPSDAESRHERDGYLKLGKVLSDEGIAEARRHLDRMIAELHPDLQPDEFYSVHQQERWLLELCSAPALLDALEPMIGPDIVLWSTHIICKRPKTGRAIPWHQDGTYWNLDGKMTSIWLAFDDVDDENGTMYVLPGYHKQKLPRRDTGDDFFDEEIEPSALPGDIADREVGYFFKAGEAAMHAVLIPHRSPPNSSPDRWRRVAVLRYISVDGKLATKQYHDYRTKELFDRKLILVRGDGSANPFVEDARSLLDVLPA